ncbi:Acetyl esterase/lipase [Lentzea waywayandensis]|uniref:Acetyl esterase/lipase n=1 Tax=Lentzea waywayandensis TaxID=84724 RepID=A0A1I6FDE0_9PSEU|nr:alpha/beta hydrolase [Lentzea waywayandensis]SFR27863.1 Acetyl esterase/lipase [Lentzea waywayandensis]
MKTVVAMCALVLVVSACSSAEPVSSRSPALAACPSSVPQGGQGQRPPQAAELKVPVDTSTSEVIDPAAAKQIQCGRTKLTATDDVVYTTVGTKPLHVDIQVPAGEGAKPLVIYVPGGGFSSADRKQTLNLRTFVAEAGYVVASIEYRVRPDGAVYTDGIADIRAAVRYLRANASTYGIDPGRIALWGESAGGYLASMAGVTDTDADSRVQAVIDKFGASDFTKLLADYGPEAEQGFANSPNPIAQYITGSAAKTLAASPDVVVAANPVTYAGPGDPPLLILHGDSDKLISPSQTLLLHNGVTKAGGNSTRYVVRGADHGDLAFAGDPNAVSPWSTEPVVAVMTDFLKAHLS